MAYKEWDERNRRLSHDKISITRSYNIRFQPKVYIKYELTNYALIYPRFDPEFKKIGFARIKHTFTKFNKVNRGIYPVPPPGARIITRNKNEDYSGYITCKSFFNRYQLNIDDVAGEYEVQEEKDSKWGTIFYIDLNKKIPKVKKLNES